MENIQDRLDAALELTFPASDPIALTPADRHPARERDEAPRS